jgi:N-acetylglucosaminyldiphosphoundecaprenol N-acetyl-beta-D-mannosaminyltransferase
MHEVRVNVLGVGISPLTRDQALVRIEDWIATGDRQYVCVSGIHGVMESQRDERLRAIHNAAGMVTPDGMPLVWLSRLRGQHYVERVYGPDLLLACCQRSLTKGYRHFFYGGAAGVPERLAERLQCRFPGLQVVGTYSPPFRPLSPEEDAELVRQVNAARPDVVWVGLSTPKQELWMSEHRDRLTAPVFIGVGAAFDFHAGLKPQAPPWMQRSGLEWLFRLWQEPRRLWRRYLRNNPLFVWHVLLQSLGIRRYQLDPGAGHRPAAPGHSRAPQQSENHTSMIDHGVEPIRAQRTKITILGAGGFIGSHMVEHLLAQGRYEVVGLDITSEKLTGIEHSHFRFYKADIRKDRGLIEDLVRETDVVVDLIAYANPSIYVTEPLEVFDLNFVQNLEIAKLCVAHRKRLIQYSSAEVYGKANEGEAYHEDLTDGVFGPVHKQRWIYATAKVLLERVLFAQGQAGHLEFTIVRPFNFIGSRIDYLVPAHAIGGPRVFPHFMSALLTGGPLRLVDGGQVRRAFMHIEDANAAFLTILEHREEARNQIFNMGNPANNLTIRELSQLMLELYEELTGVPPTSEVVEISGEKFYGTGYEDSSRLPPDITKLRALGWSPRHDIRSTFRDAMAFYLHTAHGSKLRLPASELPVVSDRCGNGAAADAVGIRVEF